MTVVRKNVSAMGAAPSATIGKTGLGNHIYADKGADHPAYSHFTTGEHVTAAAVHAKMAKDLHIKAAQFGGSATLKRQAQMHSHFASTHRSVATGGPPKNPGAAAAMPHPERMAASRTARKSLECPDINNPVETQLAQSAMELPDQMLNGDDKNMYGDLGVDGDEGIDANPLAVIVEDTGEADYINALLNATYKSTKPRAKDFLKATPVEANGHLLAD